jgi:alkylation response protein AidB-like acyl-CoA dehydrogenase
VVDRIDAHQGNVADAIADAGIADLGPELFIPAGVGRVEADMAEPGDPGIPRTIGAVSIGLAQGALDAAVKYTKERQQFGKSIAEFQGLQFILADMAMQIEASRCLVYECARIADEGPASEAAFREFSAKASMAKCFASDMAVKVTTDAVQIFGGAGYMKDFPVERFMRDAKINQIFEGTNQIHRLIVARQLLS